MKKTAMYLVAIAAGLLLAETGLRLYFHESEATRTYWGRDAFVTDPELGYRHAPSTTAWAAREGSFGPFPISTNALGFHDHREILPGGPVPPRLAVGGDSFTFGLGVGQYEKTFCVQLEGRLRADPRFPPGIEVVNMSQTGYHVDQVCALIERHLDTVRPGMVLLSIDQHDRYMTPGEIRVPEMLDGLRLSPSRLFAGTFADQLRVHTFTAMRVSASPLLNARSYTQDMLLAKWLAPALREEGSARAEGGEREETPAIPPSIAHLKARLDERGIPLVCMVIYLPSDGGSAMSDLLREAGYTVVDVRCRPGWIIGGDSHWNVAGERESAAAAAAGLPPWPRKDEAQAP